MKLHRAQVQAFIECVRALEPTIAESVKRWCELDVVRYYEQRRDAILKIPIVGFVSNIPVKRTYRKRAKQSLAQKQSFYVDAATLEEIRSEAKRHGKTITKIIHWAWEVARTDIQKFPGAP